MFGDEYLLGENKITGLTQLYQRITEIEREPEVIAKIDAINRALENSGMHWLNQSGQFESGLGKKILFSGNNE